MLFLDFISYFVLPVLWLISCLTVSFRGVIISVGEEIADFRLMITRCFEIFLFLLMLGIGWVILLWRSLCLSYNCLITIRRCDNGIKDCIFSYE